MELPEWYRLEMVACYTPCCSELETQAGRWFWRALCAVTRHRCSISYIERFLACDGIVLGLFCEGVDRLTPILKRVIQNVHAKLHQAQQNVFQWEVVARTEVPLGRVFLVQFPPYMGIPAHFADAFWRHGWEKPVLFHFLRHRPRVALLPTDVDVSQHNDLTLHDEDEWPFPVLARCRPRKRKLKTPSPESNHFRVQKTRRKARQTKYQMTRRRHSQKSIWHNETIPLIDEEDPAPPPRLPESNPLKVNEDNSDDDDDDLAWYSWYHQYR